MPHRPHRAPPAVLRAVGGLLLLVPLLAASVGPVTVAERVGIDGRAGLSPSPDPGPGPSLGLSPEAGPGPGPGLGPGMPPTHAAVTLDTSAVAPLVAPSTAPPAVSSQETPGDTPWVWPTGSRIVVRPWEAPADDYAAGHRGLDVPAALGTPVVAVADGTVAFAGPVAGRPVVTIDHGAGLVSTLDSVTPVVLAGDRVEQGAVVGHVAVGHCPATAPCVHLGARVDDRYVDPTPYLPAAAWPVLLPEDAWDP